MKFLVIGSGGREHAIVHALAKSNHQVYATSGNPGILQDAQTAKFRDEELELHYVDVSDFNTITEFAQQQSIDLVIIGPEQPLVEGLADHLRARDIHTFGPGRNGAQLEGSKIFSKRFMIRHEIPTAAYRLATNRAAARRALEDVFTTFGGAAIKADGLCGGKGVYIPSSVDEGYDAIDELLVKNKFGDAGSRVLVEERLRGREMSLIALLDGTNLQLLPIAQDYKQLCDGNTGPNTGGMGTFAPSQPLDSELVESILETITTPTLLGLEKEGIDYRGALYFGLMITKDGPKVLEYNVRFGDPEAQVIFPLLAGDVGNLLYQCATGSLNSDSIRENDKHAVCVVLASEGYPGPPIIDRRIVGIDRAQELGAKVYHAGTRKEDAQYFSTGGRVVGVTGVAHTLESARTLTYEAVSEIEFEGMHYRREIGGAL